MQSMCVSEKRPPNPSRVKREHGANVPGATPEYPPSLNPATRFWVNPTMRKGLMLKFSPYGWDSFGEESADAL